MKRLLLGFLALLAWPAQAQTILVRGGEHPDFTRLVFYTPDSTGWRLGRSKSGYELDSGLDQAEFDLGSAFARIPRHRVADLWQDPASGRLHVALDCDCHAAAFEYRPGIVVVDIKDGPPRLSARFERPLDGPMVLDPRRITRVATDRPAGDWVTAWLNQRPEPPLPLVSYADLDSLRDQLLHRISQGVAEGVVDLTDDWPELDSARKALGETPGIRVSLGEMPGLKASTALTPGPKLTQSGHACLADEQVNPALWGIEAAGFNLLRNDLVGEFDKPDSGSILNSARRHLAYGFGAETRQILGMIEEPLPPGAPILQAISYLIDLEPSPEKPFADMRSCDGAVALWAMLSDILDGAPDVTTNVPAVLRSFSSLPPHLRRHLGPGLVDRFLTLGDRSAARQIRDALVRGQESESLDVMLMDARYQLMTGHESEAAVLARAVLADSSNVESSSEALVILVELAFRSGGPILTRETVLITSYLPEIRGTPVEAPLQRAQILSFAMTGDYAGAFLAARKTPWALPDLWVLAASGADDTIFITEAIELAASNGYHELSIATRQAIAERLLSFGFSAEAQALLSPMAPDADETTRLLAARAALAQKDAKATIANLAGLDSTEARAIRAKAYLQLGDPARAGNQGSPAGDADTRRRAAILAEDWASLRDEAAEPWKSAASMTTPPGATMSDGDGPLTRSNALIGEAEQARDAVTKLLKGTALTSRR